MARKKFSNYAAVMRDATNTNVAVTKWSNIPMLRHRRRTTISFKKGKITRIPLTDGIKFIFSHYGENNVLANYPNLDFYKFMYDEIERLKGYFLSIANDNETRILSLKDMQDHLPTWFTSFIIELIPSAQFDSSMWGSYRNFYDNFYYKTNMGFNDHPKVTKLFYDRFEASLANTLEKDIISYVAPPPKKYDKWGDLHSPAFRKKMYKTGMTENYYRQVMEFVAGQRGTFNYNNGDYISFNNDYCNNHTVNDGW